MTLQELLDECRNNINSEVVFQKIVKEHDKQIVHKAFEWLLNMDIINCDGCNYQSECINNNENCFDVMSRRFIDQLKE